MSAHYLGIYLKNVDLNIFELPQVLIIWGVLIIWVYFHHFLIFKELSSRYPQFFDSIIFFRASWTHQRLHWAKSLSNTLSKYNFILTGSVFFTKSKKISFLRKFANVLIAMEIIYLVIFSGVSVCDLKDYSLKIVLRYLEQEFMHNYY